MKHRLVVVSILILIMAVVACATPQTMTAKKQAAAWMQIYNSQYDDTMRIMTSPTSTPAQKAIGEKKKAILMQTWPLLKAYVGVVDAGGTPDASQEAQLMDLINQLTTIATQ